MPDFREVMKRTQKWNMERNPVVKKIFISIYCKENTTRKHLFKSTDSKSVHYVLNIQLRSSAKESHLNVSMMVDSKLQARCLCLALKKVTPLAYILEHELYHLFVCP